MFLVLGNEMFYYLIPESMLTDYSEAFLRKIQVLFSKNKHELLCVISAQFVFLTYVLGVAWLGVFGFSAVPVFMFYNIWSTCEVIKSPQTNVTVPGDQICVDIRQYGTLILMKCFILSPWSVFSSFCPSLIKRTKCKSIFYV